MKKNGPGLFLAVCFLLAPASFAADPAPPPPATDAKAAEPKPDEKPAATAAGAPKEPAAPPAIPEDAVELPAGPKPEAPARELPEAPKATATKRAGKQQPKRRGPPRDPTAFGQVLYLRGKATKGTEPLRENATVAIDDVITTGPRSVVRILLRTGVAIQLGPSSTVRVERREDKPLTIDLVKGSILSRVRKGSGNETRYRVRTRTAALGVRGTTFYAAEEKDGRSYLCVCDGKVEARWVRGGVAITTRHHDAPKYISQDSPSTEAAPMKDHTDEEVAELDRLLKEAR